MGRKVEDEPFAESLGELSLQMVLLVVIGIVPIAGIGWGTLRVHMPGGVIATAVGRFLCGAQPVPSDPCALLPTEGEELEDGILPEVASLQEVRGPLCTTPIDIAIGRRLP